MNTEDVKANDHFFARILNNIIYKGRRTPKFQVERAISPILEIFLEKAISDLIVHKRLFVDDSKAVLQSEMITLASEFPLMKDPPNKSEEPLKKKNNQSTNFDWLMFDKISGDLLLLELKTDSASFHIDQLKTYLTLAVSERPWDGIKGNFERIIASSKSKKKYLNAKEKFDKICGSCTGRENARMNILYLAPQSIKSRFDEVTSKLMKGFPTSGIENKVAFCSFQDLKESAGEESGGDFAQHRKQLYEALVDLDKPVNYDA